MPIVHLVARARPRKLNLIESGLAARIWKCSRNAFPDALASTVMPTHAHLMSEEEDPDEARVRFAHALGCAVRGQGQHTWEPLPPPDVLRGITQIRNNLGYVSVNPCRWGLTSDPVEWLWCTHRDVIGAASDPWVTPERLARVLSEPIAGFEERYHRFVSTDRSVSERGTPLPRLMRPGSGGYPRIGIEDIQLAVASVTRGNIEDIRRRGPARQLFLAASQELGWTSLDVLAAACGVHRRSATLSSPDPGDAIDAVLLCVSDERLLRHARQQLKSPAKAPSPIRRSSSTRPLWD